jgi:DNA repair exonuclease SbcCD ATPase subunit
MREENGELEIFQDPLLTIVALILLGTLWIIIPSGTRAPQSSTDASSILNEIDKIQRNIDASQQLIERLPKEIDQLNQRVDDTGAEARRHSEEAAKQVAQLTAEITTVRAAVEAKKAELRRLEEELAARRKSSSETALLAELEEKTRQIKEHIAARDALLKGLEKRLQEAETQQRMIQTQNDKERSKTEQFKTQLAVEQKAVEALQKEKADLEKILRQWPGTGEYSVKAVSGKEPILFEATGNRLVLMNRENYDGEPVRTTVNGKDQSIVQVRKKKSVSGESLDGISGEKSIFRREINKASQAKKYVVFMVRKDSFEIFQKARQMAWQKGFKVGWQPSEDGPMYFSANGTKIGAR